ncbi:MAG: hypothetical protein KJO76_00515 [Gammaproteobacteria bacterium]|nr:hypothetical protein [Gammaproteobacteria bacterium]NND36476.1 hypothetical protein [Gammaproteobacteria bacterium]
MGSGIDNHTAMLALQSVHTIVYMVGQASVILMLWCGFTGRQHSLIKYAMICLGIILVARAVNGGYCPLHTMAVWLADAAPGEPVRDMLTPLWFNELVTPVNIPLGALGFALVAWRGLANRWQPANGGQIVSPANGASRDNASAPGVKHTGR